MIVARLLIWIFDRRYLNRRDLLFYLFFTEQHSIPNHDFTIFLESSLSLESKNPIDVMVA